MSDGQMLGVVLWSDRDARTAVIWCEDHGELALYSSESAGRDDPKSLSAGDLIQFELTLHGKLRFVRNPRKLADNRYPGVANALTEAAGALPYGRIAEIA